MSILEKLQGQSCIFERDGQTVFCSLSGGILPLVQLAESGLDVVGCTAYDKIVGKAAALLYVLLGVKKVCAAVLSQSGLKVLQQYSIQCEFDVLTDKIINRRGDGICSMEQVVCDIDVPQVAFFALKDKLQHLLHGNLPND